MPAQNVKDFSLLMLCHAIPSVWRGHGLSVLTAEGVLVTLPGHLVEAHIDAPLRRMWLSDRFGGCAGALNKAAQHGALWDVQRLLLAGAPLSQPRATAGALGWSAGHGQLEVLEHLLCAGARAGEHNNVALLWACGRGHLAVVERLLKEPDVDLAARDDWALRWARERGHDAVVSVLLAHAYKLGEKK